MQNVGRYIFLAERWWLFVKMDHFFGRDKVIKIGPNCYTKTLNTFISKATDCLENKFQCRKKVSPVDWSLCQGSPILVILESV